MSIHDLLQVVPVPARLVLTGSPRQWSQVEEALGTPLPGDYRALITTYGAGQFQGPLCIRVYNPFHAPDADSLRSTCDHLRDLRGLVGRRGVPHGVHPDRPGWLPWGEDDIGDLFCWVTEGPPDRWPTLLISRLGNNFLQVPLPMTSLLAELMSGQLPACIWCDEEEPEEEEEGMEPPGPPRFVPAGGRGGSPRALLDLAGSRAEDLPPCPCEVEWLPPDHLGRPTGVRAVLGPGVLPRPRQEFTTYPAWWGELPRPPRRWVRSQLLGWRLGGQPGRPCTTSSPSLPMPPSA
jgi:hypothetical protein